MNQKMCVLNHLKENGTITSMTAFFLYGITRLSAIIYDLRKSGFNIKTHICVDKNRFEHFCTYAEYKLITEEDNNE